MNNLGTGLGSIPWNPSKLTSLKLWLRADVGVQLAGSDISDWATITSPTKTFSGASRPTFSAAGFNGVPMATFSQPNSDVLTAANCPALAGGISVVAAVRWLNTASFAPFLVVVPEVGNLGAFELRGTPGNAMQFGVQGGGGVVGYCTGSTNVANQDIIVSATYDAATGVSLLYVNGVLDDGGGTQVGARAMPGAGDWLLGARPGGGSGYLGGYIADMVVCEGVLANDERLKTERYMGSRCSLVVA